MNEKKKYTGFAIALAWPQTFCKQPGSWYDPLALRLGMNNNHYYRVGHAAVVLIDTKSNKCHYFDFGRYHAPFQHGRVRSVETDHELSMKTIPIVSPDNRSILNYRKILSELQDNKACHGEGLLHASYCPVNFQAAFDKATRMQQISPIPYGPFRINASNCSRFVSTVIQAGRPAWKFRFRLKYLVWYTPTPMNNVNSLDYQMEMPDRPGHIPFIPVSKLDPQSLASILQEPARNHKIPDSAQWISGEGAGSWFVLEHERSRLKVTRYAPDGTIECNGYFRISSIPFDISEQSFRITYPSNCKVVSLENDQILIQLERMNVPVDINPIVSFPSTILPTG